MTNRSKSRGTAWESALCRFLADQGFPHVERRALAGSSDRGDIAGIAGWVLVIPTCEVFDTRPEEWRPDVEA